MRTPEETARLAATVTVDGDRGPITFHADAMHGVQVVHPGDGGILYAGPLLSGVLADLAEARAEVAALREVVALVAEWQAAKVAEIEAKALIHDISRLDESLNADCRRETAARNSRQAIEARLLAAVIPEVSRG